MNESYFKNTTSKYIEGFRTKSEKSIVKNLIESLVLFLVVENFTNKTLPVD